MKALDDDSLRVIREGQAAEAPDPGAADRVWEQVSAQLDAPLSPIADAASRALPVGGPVVFGLLAKPVLGTLSLIALGVAGYFVLSPARTVPERSAQAPQPVVVGDATAGASASATAARASAGASATTSAGTAADAAAPVPLPAEGLAEEAQLLGGAQRALARGRPERARRYLVAHRTRFPDGALSQEREAAWVLTLCQLGQQQDARAARRAFQHAYPGSPLTPRLRQACR